MKLTDAERARIALGWTESGLSQDEYAARFGLTGRVIRKWRSRFTADRNPEEQLEAVLVEAIAVLQNLLTSLRAQNGSTPEHAERDGHLDAATARFVTGSATFRPEQPEVGAADPQHFLSDIMEADSALASAPPLTPAAHDRPEQHPVDVAGPHPPRPTDGRDVSDGQGQPEPLDVAPLPMPRPNGGFLTPY